MRQIKFRAFNKEENHMEEPNGDLGDYIEGMISRCGHENLMQYTGLKDKNGVEIYEGDIFHDGINNCVIEFHKTNSAFIANDGSEKHYLGPHVANYKIIGNIHQNPELLR